MIRKITYLHLLDPRNTTGNCMNQSCTGNGDGTQKISKGRKPKEANVTIRKNRCLSNRHPATSDTKHNLFSINR